MQLVPAGISDVGKVAAYTLLLNTMGCLNLIIAMSLLKVPVAIELKKSGICYLSEVYVPKQLPKSNYQLLSYLKHFTAICLYLLPTFMLSYVFNIKNLFVWVSSVLIILPNYDFHIVVKVTQTM